MSTPLVVLPQYGGSRALMDRFVSALERGWPEVIVLEPPGFGSQPPPTGVPSTRELAARVIERWDERRIGRAHLFGISLGGMIAQHVAIDAPEKVDRLILASTAASGLGLLRDSRLAPLAMARCLFHPGTDANVCVVEGVLTEETLADREHMREIEIATISGARTKGELLWLAAAATAHDTRAELSRIASPTLVLTGTGDEIIPSETQARFLDHILNARQELIVSGAHDLTIEHPDECAARVLAFLR